MASWGSRDSVSLARFRRMADIAAVLATACNGAVTIPAGEPEASPSAGTTSGTSATGGPFCSDLASCCKVFSDYAHSLPCNATTPYYVCFPDDAPVDSACHDAFAGLYRCQAEHYATTVVCAPSGGLIWWHCGSCDEWGPKMTAACEKYFHHTFECTP